MTGFRRMFIWCAVLCAVAAVPASGAAQTGLPGWTFTWKATRDSGDVGSASNITARFQAVKDKLRMDISTSSVPQAAGIYMIMDPAAGTMTSIIPERQMAMVAPVGGLGPAAALVKLELADSAKYAVADLGAGEKILGHATHRYRVTEDYTIVATIAGETCSRRTNTISELWLTDDVDIAADMMTLLGQVGGSNPMAAAVADKMKVLQKDRPKGFPLKMTGRSPGGPAGGGTGSSTFDVTELTRGSLDSSLFAVPDGYQTMDTRAMMANLDPSMFSGAMLEPLKKAFCQ